MDHAVVVRLLELLGEAMEGVRAGADPRTRLELALVKAARPEVDASTRALLARIERLERERGRSPATAPHREVPGGGGPSPRAACPAPRRRTSAASRRAAARRAAPAARCPRPPRRRRPHAPVAAPLGPGEVDLRRSLWPAVVELVGAGENALWGA